MESPGGSTPRSTPVRLTPSLITRGPQQPKSHSSCLLEDVLAEKKMGLMKSPEVVEWLREFQQKIQEEDCTVLTSDPGQAEKQSGDQSAPVVSQRRQLPNNVAPAVEDDEMEVSNDSSVLIVQDGQKDNYNMFHLSSAEGTASASDGLAYTSASDGMVYTSASDGMVYTSASNGMAYTSAGDGMAYTSAGDGMAYTSAGDGMAYTSAGAPYSVSDMATSQTDDQLTVGGCFKSNNASLQNAEQNAQSLWTFPSQQPPFEPTPSGEPSSFGVSSPVAPPGECNFDLHDDQSRTSLVTQWLNAHQNHNPGNNYSGTPLDPLLAQEILMNRAMSRNIQGSTSQSENKDPN